jgi:DNA polymerase III subunit gamma/tau
MAAVLSLYRRHRPRSFDEVVGQEHIVRTLRNAIELGKVHHAYLFVGSRGTGKTSMAKLLACALNAEGGPRPDFAPDDPVVKTIMSGNSLDVVEMDAASNNSVDDIRDLRENVALAPMGGGRRVYILDEAHMLSTSAWNAFLKTLEEPPPHVVFVLATTEAHKVPATIVDRCHRFDFQRPSLEQIASVLRRVAAEEGIEAPDAALAMIARAATGSFRDALGTLEQLVTYGGRELKLDDVLEVLGVADAELIFETADAIADHDAKAALLAVERLCSSGRDVTQFMRDLAAHLRHLFVIETLGEVPDSFAVTAEHTERLSAQAGRLAEGEVLRAIELLAAATSAVKDGSDPRIQLELALLKAVKPEVDRSMQALLYRIERLERALDAGDGGQPASEPGPHGRAAAPSAPATPKAPAPAGAAPVTRSPGHATGIGAADAVASVEPAVAAAEAVASAEPAVAAAAAEPAVAETASIERIQELWPAVIEIIRRSSDMVAAFLADARPAAVDDGRLTVSFPAGAGFAKKKVEANRNLVREALTEVIGSTPAVDYAISDDAPDSPAPEPMLSEDELLQRLKDDFNAREVDRSEVDPPRTA